MIDPDRPPSRLFLVQHWLDAVYLSGVADLINDDAMRPFRLLRHHRDNLDEGHLTWFTILRDAISDKVHGMTQAGDEDNALVPFLLATDRITHVFTAASYHGAMLAYSSAFLLLGNAEAIRSAEIREMAWEAEDHHRFRDVYPKNG